MSITSVLYTNIFDIFAIDSNNILDVKFRDVESTASLLVSSLYRVEVQSDAITITINGIFLIFFVYIT